MSVTVDAYAKINMGLDVLGRFPNGYHNLAMVMQTISLKDVITLEKREDGEIHLSMTDPSLPTDASNLAYKAAAKMMEAYPSIKGVNIHVEKTIPKAAGLAGGSADAAGVINGIDKLYNLNLSLEDKCAVGVKIGADVPFCILGHTALAEGIGEILTPLKPLPKHKVLVAKPDVDVSTKEVFEAIDSKDSYEHPQIKAMAEAVEGGDFGKVLELMGNVLELVTEPKVKEITLIKEVMMGSGALNAMMSGSGPTVFGIYDDENKARKAKEEIEAKGYAPAAFVCDFV